MPVLNAIRAFEAAGRIGSFTGAARELNISHPAISRHVRGLEEQLGVKLFRKIARGVELTDNGKFYLEAISQALTQISEASENLRDKIAGSISVSCEPTFAMKWLMKHLGGFRDKYPDIDLTLVSSADVSNIKGGDFDMAIRYCTHDYEGLEADLIADSPVYPYGRSDLPDMKEPQELLNYPLLYGDRGELWSKWFKAAGHSNFIHPKNPNPMPTLLAIEYAVAGQGIVLTSPELAVTGESDKKLKRLSNIGLPFGAYHLMYLKNTIRRMPALAFRNWIVESSAELRTEG